MDQPEFVFLMHVCGLKHEKWDENEIQRQPPPQPSGHRANEKKRSVKIFSVN